MTRLERARRIAQQLGPAVALVLLASVLAGCATRRALTVEPDAVRRDSGTAPEGEAVAARSNVAEATSRRPVTPASLESTDPGLAEALLRATIHQTAGAQIGAAREYRRVGVLDKALDYFERAIALDEMNSEAHEGVARIWRDWGMAQRGVGAAYRAVYYAPNSASAANTLGTVLHRVGNLEAAETWYRKALALDPTAWYAANNICYAEILQGKARAVDVCRQAVAVAGPRARLPLNNLALAYAAAGELSSSRLWFRKAGDAASADYNYGIALMATQKYSDAVAAFDSSLAANPTSTLTAARAAQARRAASEKQVR